MNYELGVQEFRSPGVQTNAWGGIAYLKTSQPHDLIISNSLPYNLITLQPYNLVKK